MELEIMELRQAEIIRIHPEWDPASNMESRVAQLNKEGNCQKAIYSFRLLRLRALPLTMYAHMLHKTHTFASMHMYMKMHAHMLDTRTHIFKWGSQ